MRTRRIWLPLAAIRYRRYPLPDMFWLALGYPLLAHLAVVFRRPAARMARARLAARHFAVGRAGRAARLGLGVLLGRRARPLLAGRGRQRPVRACTSRRRSFPPRCSSCSRSRLRAGEVPLITRIATVMRGDAVAAAARRLYATRHAVVVWRVRRHVPLGRGAGDLGAAGSCGR